MKKMLVLLTLCLIVFSACSSEPLQNVTVLGGNDWWITKEISNATVGIKTKLVDNKYTEFDITDVDFITEVNKRAAEKKYTELIQLLTWDSKPSDSYSFDGEHGFLNLRNAAYKPEIKLSLFSDSEDRAKRNGDYLFILMDMFNPGMQELISKELYIFEEAPKDYPSLRTLICGGIEYCYRVSDSGAPEFTITPVEIPPSETPSSPNAIKPS